MRLAIDLDSTLCAFTDAWLLWLYSTGLSDRLYENSEVEDYHWFQRFGPKAKDFFLKDPEHTYANHVLPIHGAKEFVEWCCQNFDDVEIVTHSTKPETAVAKTEWGRAYLGFDRFRFFDVLDHKFKFIKGYTLVDDYCLHIIKHVSRNSGSAVLFDLNKEYGWSKMENYSELAISEGFDCKKYEYAYDYPGVKKALLKFKESENENV